MNGASLRRKTVSAVFIVLAAAATLLMLFPVLMMLSTSFKSMKELFAASFIFWPTSFRLDNYAYAFTRGNWPRYFLNSALITVGAVTVSLAINSIAGFAFARVKFRGRELLFAIALLGLMVPPQVTMIPVFILLRGVPLMGGNDILGRGGLGLINSYAGLLVPFVAGPFGVFLFRQFYVHFPGDLDDAAKIDGLSRFQSYLHIYIPNSGPVIGTLIALKSTSTWNEYLWPLILTTSDDMKTVQLAMNMFRNETEVEWNYLMAATVIVVLPLIVLFLLTQRFFIEGIVTSGLKE